MATARGNTSHQVFVTNADLSGSLKIIVKGDMNLRIAVIPHSVNIMTDRAILQQTNVRDFALIAGNMGTACAFAVN